MEYVQEHSLNNTMPGLTLQGEQSAQLIFFTQKILDQLLEFVMQHINRSESLALLSYAGPGGSHIRHIIEHYEALVNRTEVIDYDARARDLLLETDAQEAVRRLHALKNKLGENLLSSMDDVVLVCGKSGLLGEARFTVSSTIARELIFLASHSIHHCAILKPYCEANGIAVDPHFGIAPSTVAHQLQTQSNTDLHKRMT